MSFKPLFARALDADPDRLHFAAHSHHLWPDASFVGQRECWEDAAGLADRKWDKVMGEVYPAAQRHVARELGASDPSAIAFSSNTHDFLLRLFSAALRPDGTLRLLTSDGEFHSARRQFARWQEEGWLAIEQVPGEPFDDFDRRFLDRAASGEHDLIFVSQVQFNNGHVFGEIAALAELGRFDGPWVVVDGYHAFMAIDSPFPKSGETCAFYLGGGYKYAMAGEGCCFLHAPPGFAPRPPVTGWFAEFEDLTLPPGRVGYAPDASRFLGATFDPSGLYRFNAVQAMLADHELSTARISAHCATLQRILLDGVNHTPLGSSELLNPLSKDAHARFLAFRDDRAAGWEQALKARNVVTDVRGDVLRIGFAIYQDDEDVERLLNHLGELR